MPDPRKYADGYKVDMPEHFLINDNMIIEPASVDEMDKIEVLRGPNIKEFPKTTALPEDISATCSLKVEDNITTDHIMPAGAKILPLRSNIPAISEYCFTVCDTEFPKRAKELGSSIIVGGSNYGQGSSREHAALAPLYLGVKAVLVKSFARIHRANLINAGIIPLEFADENDYNNIELGDNLAIENIREQIASGSVIEIINKSKNGTIKANCVLTERQKDIILAGGLLNYTMSK
jgi:aconitate hydratase